MIFAAVAPAPTAPLTVGASGFALVCPGRGPRAAPPGACASGDVDADVSVGEDGDDAEDTVDADGAGMGASVKE